MLLAMQARLHNSRTFLQFTIQCKCILSITTRGAIASKVDYCQVEQQFEENFTMLAKLLAFLASYLDIMHDIFKKYAAKS